MGVLQKDIEHGGVEIWLQVLLREVIVEDDPLRESQRQRERETERESERERERERARVESWTGRNVLCV